MPDTVVIRNIARENARDHAAELADLWTRTFFDAYKDVHSPENIETYTRENLTVEAAHDWLAKPGIRCAIAERNGAPVGYCMVRYIDSPIMLPGPSAELKQIYILASEYGRGTGRALFEHARARVLGTGRSWMWLFVADNNDRAKAFYEGLDFARFSKGPVFHVGTDKLPSSLMARAL